MCYIFGTQTLKELSHHFFQTEAPRALRLLESNNYLGNLNIHMVPTCFLLFSSGHALFHPPPPENGQRTWRIVVDVGVVEKRRRKNGEDLECGEQIDWPWVDRWAKWWHNPAWKYIQDMFSKYTKSDFEIGLVQFFKDDCTDLYFLLFILEFNDAKLHMMHMFTLNIAPTKSSCWTCFFLKQNFLNKMRAII